MGLQNLHFLFNYGYIIYMYIYYLYNMYSIYVYIQSYVVASQVAQW